MTAAGRTSADYRRRSGFFQSLRTLDAGSTQEAILDELRRVILSGEVPPGTSIPLAEVAQHFGVSHIPVREALKSLFAEQLVDHRRNAGYAVAKLTWAELRELYIVRGVLEGAALAGAVALADEADDVAAQQALDALDTALADDDFLAYHRESRRFHFALLEPCRMHRLLHMLMAAWNVTEPYQPMSHISASDRARLHAEHRRMLDAFAARDAPTLMSLATDHQRSLEESIEALPADADMFAISPRRSPSDKPR